MSVTDPCGNVSCSDMTGTSHTTTYSFTDAFTDTPPPGNTNTFLTKITRPATNGINHIESFKYAYSSSQLTSSTDQNNQITNYIYNDSLQRPTESDYPDGGKITFAYNDSPYNPNTPSPSVTATKAITSSTNFVTVAASDGLGHPIKTLLTSDPDCTSGDRTDTTYDGLGRVRTKSNPYCATSDPTYGITTYSYDALGRTTQVTEPDGTTVLTTYSGRATQVQDEGNGTQRVSRISQTDGLGRIVSVCEVASGPFVGAGGASTSSLIGSAGAPASCGLDIGGTGFLTTYQYNQLDDLVRVAQSGIAARTFTYDSLSRLTSASNPESGTITYTYDANGNVATKVAPAPNQTGSATVTATYTYDALNRVTQKSYSDGTTPTASFLYDTSSIGGQNYPGNPVGRLVETSTPQCTTTIYEHDPMGRITYELQETPVSCDPGRTTWNPYQIGYAYDLMGNMTSFGDGYNHTYTQTFNTAARLTAAGSNQPNAFLTTYFSSAHYDAAGRILSDTLGDGETETFTYTNRGWQSSAAATRNGTPIYSFNISSFAPNGNVLASTDTVNGTWAYSYDQFNRLVGSNQNNGAAIYTYVYDRYGNRWQQNGSHSMQLTFTGNNPGNPANNNRVDGYSYDAAGNVIGDGAHTYTYDAENRITQVDGGSTATYIYNAEGNRVRRTGVIDDTCDATGTRDYVFDLFNRRGLEVNKNATQCNYEIFVGNRHLVRYGGAAYFSHTDWLGTERSRLYIAQDSGTFFYDNCASLPFGDGLSCAPGNYVSNLHFTGKERDPESGLDNFGARYNASNLGRFMSPDDPFSDQTIENPQSWNLYTYARNNPVRFTDADGRRCVSLNGEPFHNDDSGGQPCEEAAQPQEIRVGLTDDDRIRMTFSMTYDMATDRSVYLQAAQDATLAYGLGRAAWELPGLVRAGWSLLNSLKFDEAIIDAVIKSSEREASSQITAGAKALAKKAGHAAADGAQSAFDGIAPTQEGASTVIRDIRSNPARVVRGGQSTDIYNAAGQGVRIQNGTNKFIGFLEGSKASR